MATTKEYLDFVLERVTPLPRRRKKKQEQQ